MVGERELLVCTVFEVVVGDVGDEALRLALFMADDGDIAFHGMAVDVHFDRVARFASSDHGGSNRVSVGVGHVNALSDLYLHDRNSKSLVPNVRSAMPCETPPSSHRDLQTERSTGLVWPNGGSAEACVPAVGV